MSKKNSKNSSPNYNTLTFLGEGILKVSSTFLFSGRLVVSVKNKLFCA